MSRQWLPTQTERRGQTLRMRLADPLWLLWRQKELGELVAENGGSPIRIDVETEHRSLGFRGPIEPAVEAEPLTEGPVSFRVRAEAGRQALALLDDAGLAHLIPSLPALALPDQASPRDRVWARGLPDGLKVLETTDPDLEDVREALHAWLSKTYVLGEGSWKTETLAHEAEVPVDGGVLKASGYPGGVLGWEDLALQERPGRRAPVRRRQTQTMLPVRARFPGMPDRRAWAMEDGNVWIGSPDVELERLPQLLLADYAMLYGDDWYAFPVVSQPGLTRVVRVRITDCFGHGIDVLHADQVDRTRMGGVRGWQLDVRGPIPMGGRERWLLVQPPLSRPLEGPAVESVSFVRDEEANVVWAMEESVLGSSGRGERRQQAHPQRAPRQPGPRRWVLWPETPGGVFPLAPVADSDSQVAFHLGSFVGAGPPATEVVGEVAGQPIAEDVLRTHLRVERRWQRSVTAAGDVLVWLGRQRVHQLPSPWSPPQSDRLMDE